MHTTECSLMFLSLLFSDHQGTIPRWDEENSFYQEGDSSCFFKEGTVCKTSSFNSEFRFSSYQQCSLSVWIVFARVSEFWRCQPQRCLPPLVELALQLVVHKVPKKTSEKLNSNVSFLKSWCSYSRYSTDLVVSSSVVEAIKQSGWINSATG